MPAADRASLRWTVAVAGAAAALFTAVFATGDLGRLDFWWKMAAAGALLVALSAATDGRWRHEIRADFGAQRIAKIAIGLAAAALLYGVFALGNIAARALLPFASSGVNAVYAFAGDASTARIALLIGVVIGPAEELFWRGFLQRRLADRFGRYAGFAAATALYAGVHIVSGNPMLVLAALVCGVFWGATYLYGKSIWLNVVSHVAWDLAVFLVFPLAGG